MAAGAACSHSRWARAGAAAPAHRAGQEREGARLPRADRRHDTAGVTAIKDARRRRNDFAVDEAAGVDRASTPANLEDYRALVFLNTAGDLLDTEQEAALQGFVEDGKRLPRHRLRRDSRAGLELLQRPDRRAARQRTARRRRRQQTVVAGDRVHPSTRDLPLQLEPHRRLVPWTDAPDRHGPHRRALPRAGRAGRRRHDRRRHRPPDLVVPRLPRRPLLLHRHGPHRGRATARRTSASTCSARSQWTAGLVRGDCKATINANYRGTKIVSARRRRPPASPPAASRTASSIAAERLGALHRPRRLPHRRGARRACSACRRSAASSTTPTRTSASAAAACTSAIPAQANGTREQRRHARRHARRLRRRRPGRRAHQRGQPQDGVRPARHHRRAGLRRRRATSTCSTSRPSTRRARRPACRVERRDLEDVAAAHLALHDRPRRRSSSTSSSEVRIFEYDAQIFSCCHVGGGMGFDSEGNLYVTTGDTNSSQGTNGYSGNNPTAKCPTGPTTSRRARTAAPRTTPTRTRAGPRATPTTTTARCCGSGRWRHRRTGAQPAVGAGTTYALPTDDVAERPEPVRRHRGRRRQGQARDLRDGPAQPEPPVDRPGDRHPVHGVGRPGRRQPERDAGPVDVRERRADHARRQLRLAVLHGQQAGLPRPHRATATPAHRQPAPGYVPGGPATRRHRGLVRLRQPPQRLAEQHRPGRAPARDRHRRWTPARCAATTSGGAAATRARNNGCPEFPRRARRRPPRPNYGATPTQLCPYVIDQGLTVMNGPVYRYDDDGDGQLAPLARVLGRPLVPAQQRRRRASSTACCWTRRPTRTAACRSTPTASATR